MDAADVSGLEPGVQYTGLVFVEDLNDSLSLKVSTIILICHRCNNKILNIADTGKIINV